MSSVLAKILMVTKLDEELDSIEDSSVLAKILMVTKHSLILLITASRSWSFRSGNKPN